MSTGEHLAANSERRNSNDNQHRDTARIHVSQRLGITRASLRNQHQLFELTMELPYLKHTDIEELLCVLANGPERCDDTNQLRRHLLGVVLHNFISKCTLVNCTLSSLLSQEMLVHAWTTNLHGEGYTTINSLSLCGPTHTLM